MSKDDWKREARVLAVGLVAAVLLFVVIGPALLRMG